MTALLERLGELMQKSRFRILFLTSVVSVFISMLSLTGVFRDSEFFLLDKRFKGREYLADFVLDSGVATVDWDEASVVSIGRWPWTWEKHALLLKFLDYYDVKMAGVVDNHFERLGSISLEPVAASYLVMKLLDIVNQGNPEEIPGVIPRFNEEFAEELTRFGRAYFTADFSIPASEESLTTAQIGRWVDAIKLGNSPEKRKAVDFVRAYSAPAPDNLQKTLRAIDVQPPVGLLVERAAGVGFNRIVHDPDGIVRRTPLVVEFEGRLYPSISLLMAARYYGVAPEQIRYQLGEYVELPGAAYPDGRPVRIPVNDAGMMAINWAGDYGAHFTHYPFLMIADHLAFFIGKRVFQSGVTSVDQAFARAIEEIRNSGLVSAELAEYYGSKLVFAYIAESLIKNYEPFESLLDAGGGEDPEGRLKELWEIVNINNRAVVDLDFGDTPDYNAILAEYGFEDTPLYRENFDQTLHFHRKGMIEEVRPLIFPARLPLKISATREDLLTPLSMKNQSIFIGLTATALNALNPTPFAERYQMLGMQPNAFNTIITGQFLDPQPRWAEFLYILIYAAFIIALVQRVGTIYQVAGLTIVSTAHILSAWVGFARSGIIMPVVAPLLALMVGYGVAVLVRYFEERRERRKVRGLFSAMVSPEVLRIMEENPEKFNLAGEKKDATMFSSDVSGFTTISEGVTAGELASILNVYLTPMSNLIMKYGGFVDKYEGDAIKASFGIPLPDDNHPWKGPASAMEQQEELDVIARMILLKYGVKITARMGVNTGIVSAGNMGSEKKMQYTVMGKEVTIAEELEPANKIYETWVAIGPETERRSREYVETRMLDRLAMGGHDVRDIFEPLGWKRDAYLSYWRGKPVPPLFVEGWKKMAPEKVLAFRHYYDNKELPDSELRKEIRELFDVLTPVAEEYMKVTDVFEFLQFRKQFQRMVDIETEHSAIADELTVFEKVGTATDELVRKMASAGAEWEKLLLRWKIELKRFFVIEELIRGKIPEQLSEDLLKEVDTMEKNTNRYWSRCTFAKPGDEIALRLAGHLKELLVKDDPEFMKQDPASLEKRQAELKKQIAERMTAFVLGFADQAKADKYHEFIADHCVVTDTQRELKKIFERARAEYLKRHWDSAEAIFREALAIVPDDGPSIKYIARIGKLRKNPPPENWDGVWAEE